MHRFAKIGLRTLMAASMFGVMALSTGLALVAMGGSASATVINWIGNGGFSNFDNQEITFSGFQASSLDSVTASGFNVFENHGNAAVVHNMDVRLDGIWTEFWTFTGSSISASITLIVPSPILFSTATVDGIRFGANPIVGQAYHFSSGGPSFNFNTITPLASVPEPATLTLFGLGLLGLGAARRRRTRRAA